MRFSSGQSWGSASLCEKEVASKQAIQTLGLFSVVFFFCFSSQMKSCLFFPGKKKGRDDFNEVVLCILMEQRRTWGEGEHSYIRVRDKGGYR